MCSYGTAFVDTPVGDLNHDGVVMPSTTLATAYSKVQYSRYKQAEVWPTVSGLSAPVYTGSGLSQQLDAVNLLGGGWAAAADEAHFYTECSGKGLCNRGTGLCACFDGYTGSRCQRTVCPNDCSGLGRCKLLSEVAAGAIRKYAGSSGGVNSYTGVTKPSLYKLWDANKNAACECNPGYTGADCSQRVCPLGADPLAVTKAVCGNGACVNEVQGFTIGSGGNTNPNNGKTYRIMYTDFNLATYWTDPFVVYTGSALTSAQNAANAAAVVAALQALPMGIAGEVSATSAGDNSGYSNARVLVTFSTVSGNVPPMVVVPVTGIPVVTQPTQQLFTYSVTAAAGTTSVIASWTLYPSDSTGFRPSTQFSGASSAVSVSSSNVQAALLTAVNSAVQGYGTAPSSYQYMYGTTAASVVVSPATGSTSSGGTFFVTVQLPATNLSATAPLLTITTAGTGAGTTTPTGATDSYDGNTQALTCSNRGLCDFTSGLCRCFAGFTGNACQNQNALAM